MKKYSQLQYFFWLISGSEISVLKECENDYNRHSTSGAIILATCLIASVISGFAAYTYGGNSIVAAIVVAIVWGYLIFCIDRFMVISLKKDPNIPTEQQPFWKPLSIRLLFAFIIAFFMTIPLYHVFFGNKIKTQLEKDITSESVKHQEELNKRYNLNILDATQNKLSDRDTALIALINSNCKDQGYIDKMKEYTDCANGDLPKLKGELDAKQKSVDGLYISYRNNPCKQYLNSYDSLTQKHKSKISVCFSSYDWDLVRLRNQANDNYERQKKVCVKLLADADTIKDRYFANLKSQKVSNDTLLTENTANLSVIKDSIQIKKTDYDKNLEEGKTDFVGQFVALWRAAFSSPGLLLLILMLELAFIVIEIFPTYNKLRTPVGDYDWAIYYNEKSFAEKKKTDFEMNTRIHEIRSTTEIEIQQQTELKRKETQTKQDEKLINEVSRIQSEVAQQLLTEWEKQVKEDIPKNVSSFIKNNSNNE